VFKRRPLTIAAAIGVCLTALAATFAQGMLVERADWLTPMITEFLDAPMPEAE
jgi:hypothetical protein